MTPVIYLGTTGAAKRCDCPASTISEAVARGAITPDAMVETRTRFQPLFEVATVDAFRARLVRRSA